MLGDQSDFADRLAAVLPASWFAADSPVRGAILSGFAASWAGLFTQQQFVSAQTRLASSEGSFIDLFAQAFFANRLPRRLGETDAAYIARIGQNLLAPRATRRSLSQRLLNLTGHAPRIFEPTRPADTGAWGIALAYGCAGGWGSLAMPGQCFVTIRRPASTGIAQLGGYDTGAPTAYASLSMIAAPVPDAEILRVIAADLPVNAIAWTNLTD